MPYYVYILTNSLSTVLYIGVTNDLERRVYEHKHKLTPGFTSRYNVNRLVYFEETTDVQEAIAREKVLKGWRRSRKADLVTTTNAEWRDLSTDWYTETVDSSLRSE
jgi:putative endonuclease